MGARNVRRYLERGWSVAETLKQEHWARDRLDLEQIRATLRTLDKALDRADLVGTLDRALARIDPRTP